MNFNWEKNLTLVITYSFHAFFFIQPRCLPSSFVNSIIFLASPFFMSRWDREKERFLINILTPLIIFRKSTAYKSFFCLYYKPAYIFCQKEWNSVLYYTYLKFLTLLHLGHYVPSCSSPWEFVVLNRKVHAFKAYNISFLPKILI